MPLRVVVRDLKAPITAKERAALLARLLHRSSINDAGCWEWQHSRNRLGYGQTVFQNQKWMAHRLTWVATKGAIPEGMFVCHKCDNPCCVNPEHLFLGDHTANQRDMIAKNRHSKGSQTECKRGHPLTDDNVFGAERGHRACIICNRARLRIKAGWPEDLAYSMPAVPKGQRPIGAPWAIHRKLTAETVSNV